MSKTEERTGCWLLGYSSTAARRTAGGGPSRRPRGTSPLSPHQLVVGDSTGVFSATAVRVLQCSGNCDCEAAVVADCAGGALPISPLEDGGKATRPIGRAQGQ